MTIPAYLRNEQGPLMLTEALALYGTKEVVGSGNNPVILAWADEVAAKVKTAYAKWAGNWYDKDSIPWCGLFMAVVAVRSCQDRPERFPPVQYLSAMEWANFGVAVGKKQAMLGDTLVFKRDGGGHVGLYVGEDTKYYHVLGGNQKDMVCVMALEKDRCVAVRRPPYNNTPGNVRKIILSSAGVPVSTNEA